MAENMKRIQRQFYFLTYNVKNCSILYLTTQKIIMKHIEDHLNYDIADFLLIEKIKKG